MKTIPFVISVLSIGLVVSACESNAGATAGSSSRSPNDWLLGAESDEARFELLQRYLRGFDQPMWEVGERYTAIFHALERENFELALYHWEKIRTTIENGFLKRPARRANAELFLEKVWGDVHEAFASGNADTARKGFVRARDGCMQCHVAESVPYMNDQPVFELMPEKVAAE